MKENVKERFSSFLVNLKNVETCKLLGVCASLTLLYLASGYCKWIEIAVCVLAIIFMAILPLQSAMCIYIYLHSFTLSNIWYNSCFVVTFAGFAIIMLIKYIIGVKKGEFKFYKKIVVALSFLFGISILISLFHPLYAGSWMYPTYAIMFYCIFAMREKFDIAQGMNYLFGGVIISCSLALLCKFLPTYQYNIWYYPDRFTGFINNPNYLNMRVLFALSYFMYRYLNNKLSHLGFITIYLVCAGISILTQSKAGLICLLFLTALFIILFLKKDFKKNFKFILIFIGILGIFSLVGFKYIMEVANRILSSFKSNNFWNEFLTGRDEIWILYLEEIFKNPFNALFGNGVLTRQVYVATQFGFTETHNFYLFLLYRFGIIGTLMLCYIIYLFIKELNYPKPKFINFLPLIFILTISLIDNTMKYNNICYFLFAIMILFLDHKQQEQIEDQTLLP